MRTLDRAHRAASSALNGYAAPVEGHAGIEHEGVGPGTVDAQLLVQVVAGGGAGGAHVAQDRALADGLALGHRPAGHVGVEGGVVIAMADPVSYTHLDVYKRQDLSRD